MERRSETAILYNTPVTSTRAGALFNAHAYPTKIDPETIALLIACHTSPGQTVFDGFGGSGTTALATLMCSMPSPALKARAASLGLRPVWGPRKAIVYELTGLGSFIGSTLCAKVDVGLFRREAEKILDDCEKTFGWMYQIEDDAAGCGVVRHNVWSEVLECPSCGADVSFWKACVKLSPANIDSRFRCKKCRKFHDLDTVERKRSKSFDDVTGQKVTCRSRMLGRIYGATGTRSWSREPRRSDEVLLRRIENTKIPSSVPVMQMAWGDLHRTGYHVGISHVHQFYTRRNLIAVAAVKERIESAPPSVRNALNLWLSSYNLSHSTLMTRVVAKAGQDDLVVTSNQPGVLYISGLPVEKNVFRGLKRKLKTISNAFAQVSSYKGSVQVVQGSSSTTGLKDGSVDYIFTDPPFGGNIPYSEANFISEAWLGRVTANKEEAIVSVAQQKGIGEYETLLTNCFAEFRRILKPSGDATVVFHSSESAVWRALIGAFERSGFAIKNSNILDKRQGSFKQVTTRNSVKGDALLLLGPVGKTTDRKLPSHLVIMRDLVAKALAETSWDERSAQRLYSRFASVYVERHTRPPLDADQFYGQLETHFTRDGQLSLPE